MQRHSLASSADSRSAVRNAARLLMKLPLEIIRQIIHETLDDNTLIAWACVSSAARIEAESLLWNDITIHRQRFGNDCYKRIDEVLDPIEKLVKESIEGEEGRSGRGRIFPRAALVKRINFVHMQIDFDSASFFDFKRRGFDQHYVISTFKTLSSSLVNLRVVYLAASMTQEAWDALLSLPALKVLHLCRMHDILYEELKFRPGLYKLDEFLHENLYYEEAYELGLAVQDSSLKKLHLIIAERGGFEIGGFERGDFFQRYTLKAFFSGVTTLHGGSSPSPIHVEENCGFPSSLVEFLIDQEDQHDRALYNEMVLRPTAKVSKAFRGCNNLKVIQFYGFDGSDLPGVLPDLYLPALASLTIPLVLDYPDADDARSPPINILLAFIQRHVDTLKVVSILNLYQHLRYDVDIIRRLKPWFDEDQGLYVRRTE